MYLRSKIKDISFAHHPSCQTFCIFRREDCVIELTYFSHNLDCATSYACARIRPRSSIRACNSASISKELIHGAPSVGFIIEFDSAWTRCDNCRSGFIGIPNTWQAFTPLHLQQVIDMGLTFAYSLFSNRNFLHRVLHRHWWKHIFCSVSIIASITRDVQIAQFHSLRRRRSDTFMILQMILAQHYSDMRWVVFLEVLVVIRTH